VTEVQAEDSPRYRPVRLPRRTINLSAGVEDRVTGELIYVANASMAVRLARLMNDEAAGISLPARGPQHAPTRYQLAHDAVLPTSGATVLYVHRMNTRAVAAASSDEQARRVARLLTHVDYPIDELPGVDGLLTPARAHDFGDKLADLPLPSSTGKTTRGKTTRYRKRVLGVTLWLWLPLIAVAGFVWYAGGWTAVVVAVVVWVGLLLFVRRALRQ